MKTKKDKRMKRWLRALGIAKCLFEEEGYHTDYLKEIEHFISENQVSDVQDIPQRGGTGWQRDDSS